MRNQLPIYIAMAVIGFVAVATEAQVLTNKATQDGPAVDRPADNKSDTFRVDRIGDSLVDPKALTIAGRFGQVINGLSFQQSAVITHGEHQYVGYYDVDRRVCIARRKLPSGEWEIIRFTDYRYENDDAHNTISIGICPKDGTIHLAFDHHVSPLHYRVSKPGVATKPADVKWSSDLFGPVVGELEKGKPVVITYPRFLQTPEGALQIIYRVRGSGNGDRILVDYDPAKGLWKNTRQIDSGKGPFQDARDTSKSRCSYPNGYDYDLKGRLHVTWVWREGTQGANHDIMYAYSDDQGNTWHNNAGQLLDGPAHVSSPGITVVNISRAYGLMNTQAQAVDSAGHIHTVMWHCTDETIKNSRIKPSEPTWGPEDARRYHHYWRDDAGAWQHRELPGVAGNRPKLFFDNKDNAYLIFARKISHKPMDWDIYFPDGALVIMAATASSKWNDWRVVHVEKGPFVNEMLGDFSRWKTSQILSIMVQQSPTKDHEATPLRILDFGLKQIKANETK